MARVKGGKTTSKRRRNVLARVKGYRAGRSTKERQATEAIMHAGQTAFDHRRDKKNDFRRLWIARMNAALRPDMSYSTFVHALKSKNIGLDRKVLATIAKDSPESFARIVSRVKN